MNFEPFQKRFLKAVEDPRYRTIAASWPRGCGKTTCAGHVVARALTPRDPLFADGGEIVLFAGSIEQCRLTYRQALGFLDNPGDYRVVDSATRVAITHKASHTRLKAVGSNPKTSLGLVGVPLAIIDEPAALHTIGGGALWDSVRTAQGKVGSPMKVVLTGTIAPAAEESWWPSLVKAGTTGSTWVGLLQGRADRWSSWREVMRCNPLARRYPETAAVLREERDAAIRDPRLASSFKNFRLNLPGRDASEMLLSVEDWQRVLARDVPQAKGRPVVGIDLGGGRAWSAAVAVWPGGRVEALAVAPGIPSLADQEKADGVPSGLYGRLEASGRLVAADGCRIPPVRLLIDLILHHWGPPAVIVADRFREADLRDARPPCPVEPRVTRWSEASADVRALRGTALDGDLSVEPASRQLLTASLAVATVKSDDAGNSRLVKSANNKARDDCASALLLAAGEYARRACRPTPRPMRILVA